MSRCALPQDHALARIVERALGDAKAAGLDESGRRHRAVQAVMAARPDISASTAVVFVTKLIDNETSG